MRSERQKSEIGALVASIVVWMALTVYLSVYVFQWNPPKPFLTTELLGPWIAIALLSGVLVAASEWDSVFKPRNLQLRQAPGFGLGFLAYILFFLAFNTGVFLVLLYTLDGAMSRLYPNARHRPLDDFSSYWPRSQPLSVSCQFHCLDYRSDIFSKQTTGKMVQHNYGKLAKFAKPAHTIRKARQPPVPRTQGGTYGHARSATHQSNGTAGRQGGSRCGGEFHIVKA